jgi:hypothetical protein
LGTIRAAIRDGKDSVSHADHSGDVGYRVISRTTHANALFYAGQYQEAKAQFTEAEVMQATAAPSHPLLWSFRGSVL